MIWPKGKRRNNPIVRHHRDLDHLYWELDQIVLRYKGARDELAKFIGVSKVTLHRWSNGTDVPPQTAVDKMEKWAELKNMKI